MTFPRHAARTAVPLPAPRRAAATRACTVRALWLGSLMVALVVLPAAVGAQVPVPTSSPTDSAATARPPAPAPPDSLARPAAAPASGANAAVAVTDSATAPTAGAAEAPGAAEPVVPPWEATAALPPPVLAQLRAGALVRALEALPHASLRVAGDAGAPAFLSLSPIDITAPEILLDGVPTRSPADLDPCVWDRSAAGLLAVDGWDGSASASDEPRAVRLRSDPGIAGETVLRTTFSKQPDETYLRGVALTTPYASKVLRLDYEEWKTEEGFAFVTGQLPAGAGALDVSTPFGESKMRRFRAGVDVQTQLGRASAWFGRGRRFYRGTVASVLPTERWTGEMALGLDAPGASAVWQVRAYHLDFADHDFAHREARDASRLGLRAQRAPRGDGFGLLASAERVRARFAGEQGRVVLTDPTWEARVRAGLQRAVGSRGQAVVAADVQYADRTSPDVAVGGDAQLGLRVARDLHATVGAASTLRAPTLLETSGFQSFDLPAATPFTVVREAATLPLPFERQELLRAGVRHDRGGAHAQVAWERHWLDNGVGWRPDQLTAVDGEARTVGGLALQVDQVVGSLRLEVEGARRGLTLLADGHRVIGTLEHALDRGAGWPREALGVHLRVWHRLLGRRDRIALAYDLRHLGPRYDDRLAPYDLQSPAVTRHDVRLIVKLRDAELSLGVDNLTDALQPEVAGTRRRGAQVIWGLNWPFFN